MILLERRSIFSLFFGAMLLLVSFDAKAQNHGSFVGELKYTPIGGGNHKVLEYFEFDAPDGTKWGVPAGTITDGASIPRPLWSIVGSPFTGNYIRAAVVHDHFCDARTRPWKNVHAVFYHAMLAGGEGENLAKLMYLGVYYAGPRWDVVRAYSRVCSRVLQKNGKPKKVCRTNTIEKTVIIEFPAPKSDADLKKAHTASEVEAILSSKAGAEKLSDLSLAEIEAKADKARGELEALQK